MGWVGWWMVAALAGPASDWVPAGMYAAPWDPPVVGSAELFRMSAAGTEWLTVRDEGQQFEGRQAYAHLVAAGGDARVLARAACALVAPRSLYVSPWTASDHGIDDVVESEARPPSLRNQVLEYWYVADGDLIGVWLAADGTEVRRASARALVAERRAKFDSAVAAVASAKSPERVTSAVRALAGLGEPEVGAALAEVVTRHPLGAGRAAALDQLARRRDARTLALALAAQKDTAPEVRLAAVRALADLGQEGAAAVRAAKTDPDPNVAALAASLSP